MATISWSDVIADLEKFVKRNSEIKHNVIGAQGEDFFLTINKTTDIVDKWQLGVMSVGSMLQPGQTVDGSGNSFTPLQNGEIDPRLHYGQLYPAKIDLLFKEVELKRLVKLFSQTKEGSALAKSAKVGEVPYSSLVFSAIFAKLNKDLFHVTAWNATAGGSDSVKAKNILNGFKKLIADAVAASSGSQYIAASQIFAGTSLTSSNAVAQFRGVWNLVPEDKKVGQDWVLYCSPQNKELYDQNYATLFGAMSFNSALLPNGKDSLDRTSCKIVPMQGLAGSNKIIVTTPFNFEMGWKNEGDLQALTVQEFNRDLKILLDFEVGCEINDYQHVFVNDLA